MFRFTPLVSSKLVVRFLAVTLLAFVARADTLLVDAANGPGTDYTDLPPALQAAHHNDLILVRAGGYSAFSTHKGVRILGLEDDVTISGTCTVHDLPSARKFIMARVEVSRMHIEDCAGHVALQSINESPWLRHLSVQNSMDVRVRDTKIYSNLGEEPPAVDIYASEVELVRCIVRGWTGNEYDISASGSVAVRADGESRVRVSLCDLRGGTGADFWREWQWFEPGDGAPGVHALGGSQVTITGDGTQTIEGGHCGWGGNQGMEAGNGAPAIFAEESSYVRVSGVLLFAGFGPNSVVNDTVATGGSVIDELSTADPTLEVIGDAIPGQVLTMRVTGPVGGNVRYFLGRIPEINYLSGSIGPDLLVAIRTVNPGVIPASGVRDYDFVVPGNLPQGMYFLGQASVVHRGSTYRTPSQVLLVR